MVLVEMAGTLLNLDAGRMQGCYLSGAASHMPELSAANVSGNRA